MSGISDTATVTLNVNGAQAKQMMSELEAKIQQTEARISSLKARMASPKEVEKARNELKTYRKQLDEMQSATEGVTKALGDLDKATPRQIQRALTTLKRQLKDLEPGTEVWDAHAAKIRVLKDRLADLRDEMSGQQSIWDRFKSRSTSAWPAIDLLNKWGGEAIDVMRGAVDDFASMDQEMANVRKFTGMTAEQVDDLNGEFKKMDTRTSREGLNQLAQEAGRLGKTSKEDILGFVRAADQINVALDDLGEGATLTLSKLTGIFGDEERYGTEQSLLKVGSVINELSQNCSASAPYLAQFASRMGGVGAQAGFTISQIMGFGAVLDSNAQMLEASSTALSQVIVRMMQDPAKYAKVAGLDVKKFSDMLKTDVNGALILFLETLQKAGGMDVLSPMFKDMGENGSRAITALSTLATHIDEVKEQQAAANVAFAEGTSVTKEFTVQNTTAQAEIEKAKKRFQELRIELGEKLYPLMAHVISSSSALIRSIAELCRFVLENKSTIITLTAAVVAYNAVLKVHTLWLNRVALATTLNDKASKLWAVTQRMLGGVIATGRLAIAGLTNAFQYLTHGLEVNHTMQQRWQKAMAGMSFAAWTGAIIGIATALALVYQRWKKLEEERRVVENIREEAIKKVGAERVAIDLLVAAANNEVLSLEERKKAIDKLNSIIPDYNGQLDETTGKYKANKKALDDYLLSLTKKYELEGAKEQLSEVGKEKSKAAVELQTASKNYENAKAYKNSGKVTYYTGSAGVVGNTGSDAASYFLYTVNAAKSAYDVAVRKEKAILDAYGMLLQKDAISGGQNNQGNPDPDPDPDPGPEYSSQILAEKERKKKEAEQRRAAAKARKEFKAELDSYKAQRSAADRQVLELYKSGSIDYEELMKRRHDNELKYYDDSLAHFEKIFSDQKDTYLQDDKDYQKLLLDREKSDEKYEKNRIALALESIERRKNAEEKSAQHMFDVKTDPTVADEIALQAELYSIRRQALDEKLALYTEGSKEYADVQYQIEALENARELNQKRIFFKAVSELREQYDKKSASERFAREKAALDALLEANILSAEQYARYLESLKDKYKKELPGGEDNSRLSWGKEQQKRYEDDKRMLSDALASNLITQTEYYRRLAKLDSEAREQMVKGLKEHGGEWDSMLADIYTSFADLVDSLSRCPENFLDNLAKSVAAVSAVVSAGMQIATEFARAESQIQLAAVEKRYNREIELAQGNTSKVAKLEKQKEAEINKIKSEAAKKEFAMKVVTAIAQTAQNALMAYYAGLQFPFPANTVMPQILAGIAVAQGAVQIALIKKQQQAAQAQGYSKGGFTKRGAVNEPAGVVHAGEWVASQKLLANPVARPMIEALDRAQRTNTIGSLRPDDVSRSITANNSLARIAESDSSSALMVAAAVKMSHTADNLTDRLNEPFVTVNTVTGPYGINQAQDEYSRLMNNVTPKSKRKK